MGAFAQEMPIIRRLLVVLPILASGCMLRVYQPMSGMTRPVVVDTTAPNLEGWRVDVKCLEGDLVSRRDASKLCQKVTALFENQGARVKVATAGPARFGEVRDDTGELGPADLSVVLSSRKIERVNRPLTAVMMYVSIGILPTIWDQTFAQDIEVRDGSGFLLGRSTLEGRIVERMGFGPWVGNKLMDWLWREPEEELTGDAFQRNLSEDLYSHLSQEVFNARIQAEILREQVQGPPSRKSAPPEGVEGLLGNSSAPAPGEASETPPATEQPSAEPAAEPAETLPGGVPTPQGGG